MATQSYELFESVKSTDWWVGFLYNIFGACTFLVSAGVIFTVTAGGSTIFAYFLYKTAGFLLKGSCLNNSKDNTYIFSNESYE